MSKKAHPHPIVGIVILLLAVLYAATAIPSAWNIIVHTQASTTAIEHILDTYSMQNEGAKALENYRQEHPVIGFLFSSPVEHAFKLPSEEEAGHALGPHVRELLKSVRRESHIVAWWSWFLLSLSLAYAIAVTALERRHDTRAVLFALTAISVVFFVIGVLAPAMVVWTAPTIPMSTGDVSFVMQYKVRGIAAIIWDLLTGSHWIIGGFLFLFSIMTPLTKASLTFFATACRSKELNYKIGEFLHAIGRWSMADVFVAAILLALYALKFQQATKSIPCLGLYYFIGYCLLSLSTTTVLVHSGLVAGNEKKARPRFGFGSILALLAVLISFIAASSLYTYEQYTENTKQTIPSATSPQKLNSADLVLPVHKK